MSENKKIRFEVDVIAYVGKRVVVFTDTAEEAIAKALKKTVTGKNTYEGSSYLHRLEMIASSKSSWDTARFRAEPSEEITLNYDFILRKDGEDIRKTKGNFDDEIPALEEFIANRTSKG